MKMKINTQQLIEVDGADEKYYLLFKNDDWVRINEQEYNKILEDDKNDNI